MAEKNRQEGGVMQLVQKNCKNCGRLFNYMGIGHMYCPKCAEADNKVFEKIKKFIYDNGPQNITQIEEGTGVSAKKIELYLREGRLEIPENSNIYIKCEICGVEMRSGRYCPTCAAKVQKEFSGGSNYAMDEVGEVYNRKKTMAKMHFLDRVR